MSVTTKNPHPMTVVGRIAERTVRAPRLVCNATSRAILPAAMGNRAFIRAWAAHRAGVAVRNLK